MTYYEDEKEEEFEIEVPNNFNFVDEHGEFATCVVQRLMCNQKDPNTTKRHQFFYSRYSVKSNVCNFIINKRSCENIVSRALVDYLKLETKSHPHPYIID